MWHPCVCSGFAVTVFTVTSRSVTIQWAAVPGAIHYRVLATTPFYAIFSIFNNNTVIGSVPVPYPNTEYEMQVDALDDDFHIITDPGIVDALTGQLTRPDPNTQASMFMLSPFQWNLILLFFVLYCGGTMSRKVFFFFSSSQVGSHQCLTSDLCSSRDTRYYKGLLQAERQHHRGVHRGDRGGPLHPEGGVWRRGRLHGDRGPRVPGHRAGAAALHRLQHHRHVRQRWRAEPALIPRHGQDRYTLACHPGPDTPHIWSLSFCKSNGANHSRSPSPV